MDRLQEITDRYMYWEYDFNLNKEDINWLIEQVKIVQQQTKYIRRLEKMIEEKDQRIFEMQSTHMISKEIR